MKLINTSIGTVALNKNNITHISQSGSGSTIYFTGDTNMSTSYSVQELVTILYS